MTREASVMLYSPDGAILGVGLADRNVMVFNTTDYKVRLKIHLPKLCDLHVYHTGLVCLSHVIYVFTVRD